MPLLNGIDAARQFRELLPETKIVFFTMHADPACVTEAFRAGYGRSCRILSAE